MRAVVFDMVDPEFPASLAELPEPALPGPSWARIEVMTGGICGSDLHLFAHNTGPSPTLASVAAFPFVLGHETAGRVVEAGPECVVPVGTRVAVDPCIPCRPRGIEPPCANCARGWASSCLNLDSRVLTSGRSLGYTWDLGGGWADAVVAHDSMLHPLPDAVTDRGASLYEPVSIACHSILRAAPANGEPVLVVYVENPGDFLVPLDAVASVHDQKVVLECGKLDARLRRAIGHAHDAEKPGL